MKTMKHLFKVLSFIAVSSCLAVSAMAAQTNYDIGKVAGSELKIGLGPRAVAMGEAFIAKADDLNATAWNPAGLGQVAGISAGFMHNIYLEDTSLEYLAYAQNLFDGAGIGVNVMLLNYGEFTKYGIDSNNLPVEQGTFTPMSFAVTAGYGQKVMSALYVGGALKVYGLNIDTESYTAFAVDLGAIYKIEAVKGLSTALTVQNLGSAVADSSLPMLAKAGVAYDLPVNMTPKDKWSVLLDVNLPFGDMAYTSANIGTEYWYNDIVAIRAGYKIKDSGDLEGLTGLTAGAGGKLNINNVILNIDYALLTFGDLGMTHQIAFGVGF